MIFNRFLSDEGWTPSPSGYSATGRVRWKTKSSSADSSSYATRRSAVPSCASGSGPTAGLVGYRSKN